MRKDIILLNDCPSSKYISGFSNFLNTKVHNTKRKATFNNLILFNTTYNLVH